MQKTVAFYTLGCKVNQYETNAMSALFENAGYRVVPFEEISDVYVINTCTVTQIGDKKSRQHLRRAKNLNKNAVVAAVGCLAQTNPEGVEEIGVVDVILGTNQKNKIVEAVERAVAEKTRVTLVSDLSCEHEFEDMALYSFSERQRAYVKIQEGCDRFCTYCIIPYARGRIRSRTLGSTVREVERLVENGFSEIVLTGIHVASYGRDSGDSLTEVIKKVSDISGVRRIRLSSIDPAVFTSDFVDEISKIEKLCPHFHISLQSGSDAILKKMNRRYKAKDYSNALKLLRANIADVSITTDIITGFPFETEEEFKKSYEFVKNSKLCGIHVFPYSERAGTPAANFTNSVPKDERQRRAHEMAGLGDALRREFASKFIGRKMEVLFEQKNDKGLFEGFTANYIKTYAHFDRDVSGEILTVEITGEHGGELLGKAVNAL